MAARLARRVVPEAVQRVAARRAAVGPRAAQQDQWAAAPTVVAELQVAERRAAGQLAAVEPQAAARLEHRVAEQAVSLPLQEVDLPEAVADRTARKAAVRAVAEVAAVR